MSDVGESTGSSAGSDKAPSEDNLDAEEIAAIVPVEEDLALLKKLQPNLKSSYPKEIVAPKIIISPLKKRV